MHTEVGDGAPLNLRCPWALCFLHAETLESALQSARIQFTLDDFTGRIECEYTVGDELTEYRQNQILVGHCTSDLALPFIRMFFASPSVRILPPSHWILTTACLTKWHPANSFCSFVSVALLITVGFLGFGIITYPLNTGIRCIHPSGG